MDLRNTIRATFVALAIVPTLAGSSGGQTPSRTVSTVSPARFNKQVEKRQQLLGNTAWHRVSEPVSTGKYRRIKRENQATRRNCKRQVRRVRATWYTDARGYRGDSLADTPRNFAELSSSPGALDFSALGGLPYRTKLWFHHLRYSVAAIKLDIGAGGPRRPSVDLWRGRGGLANALHFTDGYVQVSHLPCRGVFRG